MKKSRNDLSRTEWSLMKICWEKGKASARVIYEETLKEKKKVFILKEVMFTGVLQKPSNLSTKFLIRCTQEMLAIMFSGL